jgi:hypothetical protein
VGAAAYLMLDDAGLVAQCAVDHYRSSGPGGQKRNKTSSAVRLRHGPTGLSVTASEDRSQHVNLKRAVRRLREAIALYERGANDPAKYVRSDLLSSCVSTDGRLSVGQRDERYHLAVAEILDVLSTHGMSVRDAAACVGCSTANLVKFICDDPKLWDRVNQLRSALSLPRLR